MAKNAKGNISSMGSSGTATITAPRPTTTKKAGSPTYEQIAKRAQEIWMKKGCLPGQDEQNWLEAERQLKAELAGR